MCDAVDEVLADFGLQAIGVKSGEWDGRIGPLGRLKQHQLGQFKQQNLGFKQHRWGFHRQTVGGMPSKLDGARLEELAGPAFHWPDRRLYAKSCLAALMSGVGCVIVLLGLLKTQQEIHDFATLAP